jgi:hypothetical protein
MNKISEKRISCTDTKLQRWFTCQTTIILPYGQYASHHVCVQHLGNACNANVQPHTRSYAKGDAMTRQAHMNEDEEGFRYIARLLRSALAMHCFYQLWKGSLPISCALNMVTIGCVSTGSQPRLVSLHVNALACVTGIMPVPSSHTMNLILVMHWMHQPRNCIGAMT